MTISEVTIISRGFPPTLVEKPNINTVNLLSIVLNSQVFSDFMDTYLQHSTNNDIKEVVKSINEKLSGWDSNYFEKSRKLETEFYPKNISKEIIDLVSSFGLPKEFELDFYLLLNYKAFRDITKYPDIQFYSSSVHMMVKSKEFFERNIDTESIVLTHQVSKNELIKWIEDNWEEYLFGSILKLPVSPVIKTDFKDIGISSEIYNLHKLGRKPSEILNILSEKYKENEEDKEIYDLLSLEFINNKIKRFKKLLSKQQKILQPTEIIYE